MPPGRPLTYTAEVGSVICKRLADGQTLRQICRDEGMPPESTVRGWVVDDVQGFAAQYARARDLGLDAVADELFEIADDGSNDRMVDEEGNVTVDHDVLGRSKLRVDTRKWYLSKLAPKRYGDRTVTEHTGPNGGPIEHKDMTADAAQARIRELMGKLGVG